MYIRINGNDLFRKLILRHDVSDDFELLTAHRNVNAVLKKKKKMVEKMKTHFFTPVREQSSNCSRSPGVKPVADTACACNVRGVRTRIHRYAHTVLLVRGPTATVTTSYSEFVSTIIGLISSPLSSSPPPSAHARKSI